MSQILFSECNCEGVEKIFLVHYITKESSKLFCNNCFAESTNRSQSKFAYNIKTRQRINTHSITQFIRKNSSDYFCEDHNASYPTLKSLKEDHEFLDSTQFVLIDKREIGKVHTEKFSEMDNS